MQTVLEQQRILLVAWAPSSPRFADMAAELNGQVVCLNILFGKKWAAPMRYLLLTLKTFSLLRRERPTAVLAQNPPIFCPLSLVVARRFMKFNLIVDHHAVWSIKSIRQPGLSRLISALERFVARSVKANTTANENWTRMLRSTGATDAFTYHDFVPMPSRGPTGIGKSVKGLLPPHRFLIIAAHGGHPQELLEEEVAAVDGLGDYLLVITGRREKIAQRLERLGKPLNVVYAGYLDQADYEMLKGSADVALSLSREPNTVPHALYEFLVNGIPTVVLRDELLHSIFDGAVVEAGDSRPESIQDAIRRVCEDSRFRTDVLESIERNYRNRTEKHREEISRLRQYL